MLPIPHLSVQHAGAARSARQLALQQRVPPLAERVLLSRQARRRALQRLPLRAEGVDLVYRGTSLIRKRVSLGPYGRTMPRGLWQS